MLVYKRLSDGSGVISGTIIYARITQQSDTICGAQSQCYCHHLRGIYAVVAHSRSVIRANNHYGLHGIIAGHGRRAGTCVK